MVLFEDEVCFRELVPCGEQGLIEDGEIMAACGRATGLLIFYVGGCREKTSLKIKKGGEKHKAM